jgi:hypothetical protein
MDTPSSSHATSDCKPRIHLANQLKIIDATCLMLSELVLEHEAWLSDVTSTCVHIDITFISSSQWHKQLKIERERDITILLFERQCHRVNLHAEFRGHHTHSHD